MEPDPTVELYVRPCYWDQAIGTEEKAGGDGVGGKGGLAEKPNNQFYGQCPGI